MTLDLFDTPALPGLRARAELIDASEERMLIDRIDATDLTPFRFQGWTGKRLTTSFGWSYDFEIGRPKEAPPIPAWLRPFRDRAAAFGELDPEELIQALLIRYGPGSGIGWHRDRPIYGHILGISLGEPATLRFRRRHSDGFDRASVPLDPRAAYHLSGPARHEWEHSIVEMERPRWSITFRTSEGQTQSLDQMPRVNRAESSINERIPVYGNGIAACGIAAGLLPGSPVRLTDHEPEQQA